MAQRVQQHGQHRNVEHERKRQRGAHAPAPRLLRHRRDRPIGNQGLTRRRPTFTGVHVRVVRHLRRATKTAVLPITRSIIGYLPNEPAGDCPAAIPTRRPSYFQSSTFPRELGVSSSRQSVTPGSPLVQEQDTAAFSRMW